MLRLAEEGRPGYDGLPFINITESRIGMKQFYDAISEFIFVENKPRKSDVIFVPGGAYPDAAIHAASLYHQKMAPYILPSGKYSITAGRFELPREWKGRSGYEANSGSESKENKPIRVYETEFEYLREILLCEGVDDRAILKEDQATFTYQNAIFSRRVLEKAGIEVRRAILCCQAFHARRALLYYQEQFPKTEFLVSPVVTRGIGKETWMTTEEGIDTVLGEVERCGSQFHEILRSRLKNS